MNRQTYRTLRRSIRDNGTHALRWMTPADAAHMLATYRPTGDYLETRQWFARDTGPDRIKAHPCHIVRPPSVTKMSLVSRLP